MAFRRSIASRAKHIYQEHRISPSFSLINTRRDDEDNGAVSKSQPSPPKIPYFPVHPSRFSAFSGHQLSSFSCGPRHFGRSMSTAASVGEGAADKMYMGDMAEVLAADNTIEAVVAQAAPAVNEVAAAAADSFFPVAALQYLIEYVHIYTGFNWWGSIIATTFMIRLLTTPLMINQLKATSKFTLLRPRLEEVKEEMQNKGMDPGAVAEGQEKMQKLFKEYGVTPFTPLRGLLFQGPVFISFFLAINNMVEKVPSFKQGGAFWFTDLTTPDAMYILPVLTGLTFWITVECNMQEGMEGNPAANTIKNVSRGFAVLTVPFTASFAKGVFCYWITSNVFSLMYGLVIKNPAVKNALGIPIIKEPPPPPSTNGQKPAFSFFEAVKKYAEAQAAAKHKHIVSSASEGSKSANPLPTGQVETSSQPRISSSSVISQRLKTLEREVKGRKKGKKR